ncbi:hypothetical protein ACFU98_30835 [Streptomyces sp. NPDC057575]|uniref:hypothetical protein n=1 Tax=unclassified Streptomyces TaxID=2593676 RepID=UPI00368BC1A2
MRTHKAFAALGSALFVASLAFAPALTSQASAAPKPAQAAASHDFVTDSYRDGYRQGFRNGYADARDDCILASNYGFRSQSSDQRWSNGYANGYDDGYSRAFDRFC